jgi:hypothetical protein
MASDYRIGIGHNIALASLKVFGLTTGATKGTVTIGGVDITVNQPSSEGLKATRRDISGDGLNVYDKGLYVELVWPILRDKADVQALFTLCGINAAKANWVTVYCRDDLYNYQRYNGTAVRPPVSWTQYRPRNITILIRDLVFST